VYGAVSHNANYRRGGLSTLRRQEKWSNNGMKREGPKLGGLLTENGDSVGISSSRRRAGKRTIMSGLLYSLVSTSVCSQIKAKLGQLL
jgi:hypothetical protein